MKSIYKKSEVCENARPAYEKPECDTYQIETENFFAASGGSNQGDGKDPDNDGEAEWFSGSLNGRGF